MQIPIKVLILSLILCFSLVVALQFGANFIPLERVYEQEMLKEGKSMERIFQKHDIEEICTEKRLLQAAMTSQRHLLYWKC